MTASSPQCTASTYKEMEAQGYLYLKTICFMTYETLNTCKRWFSGLPPDHCTEEERALCLECLRQCYLALEECASFILPQSGCNAFPALVLRHRQHCRIFQQTLQKEVAKQPEPGFYAALLNEMFLYVYNDVLSYVELAAKGTRMRTLAHRLYKLTRTPPFVFSTAYPSITYAQLHIPILLLEEGMVPVPWNA